MFKFNKVYNLIIEDIIQSVTPEELKERQATYPKIVLKNKFDNLLKENRMIKNEDSSYIVTSDIDIAELKLTTLQDIPYKLARINGSFDCSFNYLTNLEGSPKETTGMFSCSNNNLSSLIGAPTIVWDDFYCDLNALTRLTGCPALIKSNMSCDRNILSDLYGCPSTINGFFDCSNNMLTSLRGCPKVVKDDFYINNDHASYRFSEKEVRSFCKVGGKIYV